MASIIRNIWGSFVGPVSDENPYDPSVKDVLHVKDLLNGISSFPLELIDRIIDLAEYWPRTTTATSSLIKIPHGPHESQFIVCPINILVCISQLINYS
jgi:hypothetical protein